MQIITHELENLNLYSPSTGEVICHEDTGYNHKAQSLMAYWVKEVMDQPFINNPELQVAWDEYWEQFDDLDDDEYGDGPDVDEFLKEYDNDTWLVFKIETAGMPGDIAWFVVDMNVNTEND